MKISNTQLEVLLHSAELKGSSTQSDYWFFNVDVITSIDVETENQTAVFYTVLQAGMWCYGNDYSTPSKEVSYSDEGGCHEFIYELWNFTEQELEELDDDNHGRIVELAGIDLSKDDLLKIYLFLCDLKNEAQVAVNDEIEENGQPLKDEYKARIDREMEEYEFLRDIEEE